MAIESQLQSKIVKWLKKEKKCFVMVTTPGGGIPCGTADVFFCKEGFYGWIEVKASKTSKFQPLQKEFISQMDEWSWARVAYPENWEKIKIELLEII